MRCLWQLWPILDFPASNKCLFHNVTVYWACLLRYIEHIYICFLLLCLFHVIWQAHLEMPIYYIYRISWSNVSCHGSTVRLKGTSTLFLFSPHPIPSLHCYHNMFITSLGLSQPVMSDFWYVYLFWKMYQLFQINCLYKSKEGHICKLLLL